ncbi:MAG TPA: hypothetical protein ENL20_03405 [Candidatus Cloacimonetes bacterium]|nr:hypothetical protein [Candidatus Cloacimonadota bacterium]
MYMIINLNKEKYLDDVLMALTEAGIDDTIVLSGETVGHKLAFDNPIFAGFRKSFGSGKGYANVIMAIAEQDQIDFMLEELKNSGVDFVKDEIGKIVLLPVEKII